MQLLRTLVVGQTAPGPRTTKVGKLSSWSRSQSILSRMLISGRGYQLIALLSCDTPACRSSHNYEPRCELQAVAVLSALELLSEGACPQRLSQIARQLCQWKPHRYLIIGSAQKHDMQVFHAQTVIRLLAVTGEDARPATVSTRRALLQTGPALLGSLQCYTLLLNELVYGCHASLQLYPASTLVWHGACRYAFHAAGIACSGCWLPKGM